MRRNEWKWWLDVEKDKGSRGEACASSGSDLELCSGAGAASSAAGNQQGGDYQVDPNLHKECISVSSNILKKADEIVNNRSEEKERQYGPFGEGMERAAKIASGMTGKDFTAHDMFAALVALKFSRQSYNFKEDNLLDAVAYIGAWQNYINQKENAK